MDQESRASKQSEDGERSGIATSFVHCNKKRRLTLEVDSFLAQSSKKRRTPISKEPEKNRNMHRGF